LGRIPARYRGEIDASVHAQALDAVKAAFSNRESKAEWLFLRAITSDIGGSSHRTKSHEHRRNWFRYFCESGGVELPSPLTNAFGRDIEHMVIFRDGSFSDVSDMKSSSAFFGELAWLYAKMMARIHSSLSRAATLASRVRHGDNVDHTEWAYLIIRAFWEERSVFSEDRNIPKKDEPCARSEQNLGQMLALKAGSHRLLDPATSPFSLEVSIWANLHVWASVFRFYFQSVSRLLQQGLSPDQVLLGIRNFDINEAPAMLLTSDRVSQKLELHVWVMSRKNS